MPESIQLTYPLSQTLWRQFFNAHYHDDSGLKWCARLGALCVTISLLGFAGFYPSQHVARLLLATGLFGFTTKQLLIFIAVHKASCHPFFNQQLTVTISEQEIAVRCGQKGYSQSWHNFNGYRHYDLGFALYHDRHAFFFIPMSAMSTQEQNDLQQRLDETALPLLTADHFF
ncbi:MAG: hypothetical protein BA874_01895 [Desulfuromonadales bacterium C00003068]|nr:MAG: hypothetical protein BA874_01895 [Desulfuromonadales bacterium C00003068]